MITLKSCPFCGGHPYVKIVIEDLYFHDHFRIACSKCKSSGAIYENQLQAIEGWNTRE